jgi:translation initiation factor 5
MYVGFFFEMFWRQNSSLTCLSSQDAKKKKSKSDSDEEKKKAKKEKKKEKKSKKDKKSSLDGDNGKDYIKEALTGGKKGDDIFAEISDDEKSLDSNEASVDDDSALDLAVQATKTFLKGKPDFTNSELIEYVTNQQMASALKAHHKVHILVRACITPDFYKNNEIKKFASAIGGITNGSKIMERHLIAACEFLCTDKPKNFPVMIKQFYDEDALEEEAILEWADDGRTEYTLDAVDEETRATLRGEAEPVVVWLQEADSDDESTDED